MNNILILTLPLISAILTGAFALRQNIKILHYIAAIIVSTAAVIAFIDLIEFTYNPTAPQTIELFRWISIYNYDVVWHIKRDSLTVMMNLVVTSVSAIVHFYSIGYMYEDKKVNRFFSYLSLFTFFMLILVASNNLIQLFVGWEGVGLCSYLLIGFWYHKDSANSAAIKAFLVNRVGDFAFLIGVLAIYNIFQTTELDQVFASVEMAKDKSISILGYDFDAITFICVMLFVGCMGKSAQLGLHTWLPDAMEGPTPVSALIHAATMVTAGVYLVVRCSPLFEESQFALDMITVVGALTCFFAATVATVQNDIKKVIAYSTCSQLGYMFFACGVSAYSAGFFHLVTHAFFKALLFLTAGNVIIALHHEQDIRKMGGLWKKIPMTYLMVWIGSLAIAGIPPFSGYFSKDFVLEAAYMSHSKYSNFAFFMGTLSAGLTAFYSFRLLFLTFHGESKNKYVLENNTTKLPYVVVYPLVFLVIGSIFAGYTGYSILELGHNLDYFEGAIYIKEAEKFFEEIHHVPHFIKLLPLIVSVTGIFVAALIYLRKDSVIHSKLVKSFPRAYNFLVNKWYFDEIYNALIVQPYKKLSNVLWKAIDVVIIDGLGPNGLAKVAGSSAKRLIRFQSGYIYHYAFIMILGAFAFISWYYFKTI